MTDEGAAKMSCFGGTTFSPKINFSSLFQRIRVLKVPAGSFSLFLGEKTSREREEIRNGSYFILAKYSKVGHQCCKTPGVDSIKSEHAYHILVFYVGICYRSLGLEPGKKLRIVGSCLAPRKGIEKIK
jgi:hypothetical protein